MRRILLESSYPRCLIFMPSTFDVDGMLGGVKAGKAEMVNVSFTSHRDWIMNLGKC